MSTYDLFLSYHEISSSLALTVANYLSIKLNYVVYSNNKHEGIQQSKVVVLFITEKYCQASSELVSKIHGSKKPVVILMLENLGIDDLGSIARYVIDRKRLAVYKELDSFKKQAGTVFKDFAAAIKEELEFVSTERERSRSAFAADVIISSVLNPKRSPRDKSAEPVLHRLTTFTKIKSVKKFKLNNSVRLRGAAFCEEKNCLVVCDVSNKSLLCIDTNGNYLTSYNPDLVLKGPCAICIDNKSKEIYVSDWTIDKIFVFNTSFKLLRRLDTTSEVDTAFDICFDQDTKQLFISDSNNDVVSVIQSKTGQLIKNLAVKSPKNLEINGNYVFILSDNNKKAYILKLNKVTLQEVAIIRLTDLCLIRGLQIDAKSCIYVTAYEQDTNRNILWDSAAIYIFSANDGLLLSKIRLGITGLWDIFLHEESTVYIILETETQNYIIEFE